MKLYTVINNANSNYTGKFNTKEEAQALADKLNDEAIDRGNHQIFYNVELLDFEDETMNTKNNTTESIHSPKNRYRAEIRYDKALKDVGSVQSFTSNNLDELMHICSKQVAIAKTKASVKVIENVDIYPRFDWQDVAVWKMNELGCLTSD